MKNRHLVLPSILIFLLCLTLGATALPRRHKVIVPSTADLVFESLKPVIFQIKSSTRSDAAKTSYGTGFVIGSDGLVLTNYHVVSDSVIQPDRYRLYLIDGYESYSAKILKFDLIHDLALLKVSRTFAKSLPLATELPPQGETVFSLGMPKDLNMSILQGIYNNVVGYGAVTLLHMTSSLNGGMSGGPTVNKKGELIGVNVSHHVSGENISFAVPLEFVKAFVKEVPALPEKIEKYYWEAELSKQLKTLQELSANELREALKTQKTFETWKVPGWPTHLRCWADDVSANKDQYMQVTQSCESFSDIYISQDMRSRAYQIRMTNFERHDIGALAFYKAVDQRWVQPLGPQAVFVNDEGMNEQTRIRCSYHDARNSKGVPLRVEICLNSFSRFRSLYNIELKMINLERMNSHLIYEIYLSAFSLDEFQKLFPDLINSVERL